MIRLSERNTRTAGMHTKIHGKLYQRTCNIQYPLKKSVRKVGSQYVTELYSRLEGCVRIPNIVLFICTRSPNAAKISEHM